MGQSRNYIGDILKIADVPASCISHATATFLQCHVLESYKDQDDAKEHIYNIDIANDSTAVDHFNAYIKKVCSADPEFVRNEITEVCKQAAAMDCAYIRIIDLK